MTTEPATRAQHARCLAQLRQIRIVETVDDHRVEARGGEWERAWITEAQLRPQRRPSPVQALACAAKVLPGADEHDRAADAARERRNDRKRGVSRIQKRVDRCLAELRAEHGAKLLAVLPRVAASRGQRRGLRLAAPRLQRAAALEVERERRIGGIQRFESRPDELSGSAGVGEPVIDPVLLPGPQQQSRIAEHLQVPGHTRLALSEDGRNVRYRQLPGCQQRQDSQPRRFGCGSQQVHTLLQRLIHDLHI
jgi:hypothetical protein